MNRIRRIDLKELSEQRSGPCLSLFMPMTLTGRDSREDVKRLRELTDKAEQALIDRGLRRAQVEAIMEPIRALPEDAQAWPHRGTALAIFAAPGFMRIFHCE